MRTRRILVAVAAVTVGLVGAGTTPAAAGTRSAGWTAGNSAAGSPSTGVTAPRPYRRVDLGGFRGADGRATAINASGQVVGYSETAEGHRRAFLFSCGRRIDLGTLGGTDASAADINAAGQVVGYSDTANGESHAFLWSQGHMADLGTLGGTGSTATAINDAGTVVGTIYRPTNYHDNGHRAFVWRAGQMTQLAGLPGSGHPGSGFYEGTTARDVNLDGDVVGFALGESALVRWRRGVPTVLYQIQPFQFLGAVHINRPGDILLDYASSHYGFTQLWRAGSSTPIAHLLGPGAFAEYGAAINDNHQFVGGYTSTPSFTYLPYVSSGDFTLLDLTTRGLAADDHLSDINNSGQIAGSMVVGTAIHPALFLP